MLIAAHVSPWTFQTRPDTTDLLVQTRYLRVEPEKSAFLLPVTTRTHKQRQGSNLYRLVTQVASDLRDGP